MGRFADNVDTNRKALRRPLTDRDQAVLEHLHRVIPSRPTAIERALSLKKHSVQSTLSKLSQRGLATRTEGGWIRT